MDHTETASRLMVEQGLTQDAADFAADQILVVAKRINDQRADGKFSVPLGVVFAILAPVRTDPAEPRPQLPSDCGIWFATSWVH